jgi:hypothetical protein
VCEVGAPGAATQMVVADTLDRMLDRLTSKIRSLEYDV